MEGGPDSAMLFDNENYSIHELSGILPRTADFMFKEIARIKTQFKREYSIKVSSLEIYCEHVRDLFGSDNENG